MTVVTIRGPLGSGAPEIGRMAADALHIDYVDREIIAEVATRLRYPKRAVEAKELPPSTLLERIEEALEHVPIGAGYPGSAVYLPTWEIPLDNTSYLAGLESVIRELARGQSVVIRGRGSQFILKDYPGALHVLVAAPPELRVKRVMQSLKIDEEAARKEMARFDNSRREFIKKYFKAELEDPKYYDLVINTEHLSFEAAASIIVGAVPFKERTVG